MIARAFVARSEARAAFAEGALERALERAGEAHRLHATRSGRRLASTIAWWIAHGRVGPPPIEVTTVLSADAERPRVAEERG